MKKIPTFTYRCEFCGSIFEAPSLGDFVYGEFILWSKNSEYRYLNALEDVVYQEVISLIEQQEKTTGSKCEIQEIFGRVACDADSKGDAFNIINPPCPTCNSVNVTIQEVVRGTFTSVPHVTHKHWASLSKDEKNAYVICAIEGG